MKIAAVSATSEHSVGRNDVQRQTRLALDRAQQLRRVLPQMTGCLLVVSVVACRFDYDAESWPAAGAGTTAMRPQGGASAPSSGGNSGFLGAGGRSDSAATSGVASGGLLAAGGGTPTGGSFPSGGMVASGGSLASSDGGMASFAGSSTGVGSLGVGGVSGGAFAAFGGGVTNTSMGGGDGGVSSVVASGGTSSGGSTRALLTEGSTSNTTATGGTSGPSGSGGSATQAIGGSSVNSASGGVLNSNTGGSNSGGIQGSGGTNVGSTASGGTVATGGITSSTGGAGIGGTLTAGCAMSTSLGSNYIVCTTLSTFTEAETSCESMGMRLPRIDSSTENVQVANAVKDSWLGANDLAVSGEWRWLDGAMFWSGFRSGSAVGNLYSAWSKNEPSGTPATANCVRFDSGGYVWVTVSCTGMNTYVCEAN